MEILSDVAKAVLCFFFCHLRNPAVCVCDELLHAHFNILPGCEQGLSKVLVSVNYQEILSLHEFTNTLTLASQEVSRLPSPRGLEVADIL